MPNPTMPQTLPEDYYSLPEPPSAEDIPDDPFIDKDGVDETETKSVPPDVKRLMEAGMPLNAITAFAVVQNSDGSWGWTNNLELAALITLDHQSTPGDVWHGGEGVAGDIQLMLTVSNTVQNVMANLDQRAQMAAQQMQNQALARQIIGSNGRPIEPPNRQNRRHPGPGGV